MKRILPIVVCVLVAANVHADPVDDVRCQEIAFSKSVEDKDIDAFRSFIDADARFVGNAVLHGVDEIASSWAVFFGPGLPGIMWRPQVVEVLEDGKLALSRGPYVTTSADEHGDKVFSWGTFNSVWRLHDDGEWKVVFDAGNAAEGYPDKETMEFLSQEDDC